MKKINQEIEKIELLFNETINLAKQDLIDASLMYCRKIVEGMLLIIQNKENFNHIELLNTTKSLRIIENHIKSKYKIENTEVFFEKVKTLQFFGNRAAHFVINEPEVSISINEIVELLSFTFKWFKGFITKYHKIKESEDLYFNSIRPTNPVLHK